MSRGENRILSGGFSSRLHSGRRRGCSDRLDATVSRGDDEGDGTSSSSRMNERIDRSSSRWTKSPSSMERAEETIALPRTVAFNPPPA